MGVLSLIFGNQRGAGLMGQPHPPLEIKEMSRRGFHLEIKGEG